MNQPKYSTDMPSSEKALKSRLFMYRSPHWNASREKHCCTRRQWVRKGLQALCGHLQSINATIWTLTEEQLKGSTLFFAKKKEKSLKSALIQGFEKYPSPKGKWEKKPSFIYMVFSVSSSWWRVNALVQEWRKDKKKISVSEHKSNFPQCHRSGQNPNSAPNTHLWAHTSSTTRQTHVTSSWDPPLRLYMATLKGGLLVT